jgi:serine/threonine-protein kinase
MLRRTALILLLASCCTFALATCASAQTPSAEKTNDVVFGDPKTYSDVRKWFTVDLPSNWTIKDKSDPDELNLGISDPTENAAVSIHVWKQGTPLPGGPAKYLSDYLKQTVAKLDNYEQGDPRVQKDGSTAIYFKWDENSKVGVVRMWGDAFIEERGGLVGLIVFLIPEEQYKRKEDVAYRLINSFHITP